MLTLGLSDARLLYLAEGAANIVYRIHSASSAIGADLESENTTYGPLTPPPTEIEPMYLNPALEGKLVRLRKNLSTTVPVSESYAHYESVMRPLFSEDDLVQATLFHPSRDLLRECNADLREMERIGSRPVKRHGLYLAEDERHGCLITDMSWIFDDSFECYEFKPKWLVQSPSAPTGSKRCRTCAVRAMKIATGGISDKSPFCPLDLVSTDKASAANTIPHILGLKPQKPNDLNEALSHTLPVRITDFLFKNPLLHRLRQMQLDLDPVGVLQADLTSSNFLAAMTLRDCSLFLKVPRNKAGAIEARLGDLDLKNPNKEKASYWRNLETTLIDDGWYTATEENSVARENICQLA